MIEILQEDVCLDKKTKSLECLNAVINNDPLLLRSLFSCGVYINERIGPWGKDILSDIWHSSRGGAPVDDLQMEALFTGTSSISSNKTRRNSGIIPYFNIFHENCLYRPTYLHIALLLNCLEAIQTLMLMGVSLILIYIFICCINVSLFTHILTYCILYIV